MFGELQASSNLNTDDLPTLGRRSYSNCTRSRLAITANGCGSLEFGDKRLLCKAAHNCLFNVGLCPNHILLERVLHAPLAFCTGVVSFVVRKLQSLWVILTWTSERSHGHQLPTSMIACTFRVMGPGSLACYLVLASLSALSAYATAEMAWLLDLIEWISFILTADSLQFVARGPSLRAVLWIMTIVLHGSYLGDIFKIQGPTVASCFWKFVRMESSWDRLSTPLNGSDFASAEIWERLKSAQQVGLTRKEHGVLREHLQWRELHMFASADTVWELIIPDVSRHDLAAAFLTKTGWENEGAMYTIVPFSGSVIKLELRHVASQPLKAVPTSCRQSVSVEAALAVAKFHAEYTLHHYPLDVSMISRILDWLHLERKLLQDAAFRQALALHLPAEGLHFQQRLRHTCCCYVRSVGRLLSKCPVWLACYCYGCPWWQI